MVAVYGHKYRITPKDLTTILEEQLEKSKGIQGITVLSPDGLPIATTTVKREHVISAMAAASISLSERVVKTLNRGEMEEIMLCGTTGFVIIRAAGDNAAISVTAQSSKNYGMARLVAKRLAHLVEERL